MDLKNVIMIIFSRIFITENKNFNTQAYLFNITTLFNLYTHFT